MPVKGDQYTYVALSASTRAIIAYRTGKRDSDSTHEFIYDLRERVIGAPEISTDGFLPYQRYPQRVPRQGPSRPDRKDLQRHQPGRKDAARRYSPAEVISVERDVVSGTPVNISTSYVERAHLTMRMQCRRFGRLTNAFSKTLTNHAAPVSLHIAFYNLCRVHETTSTTPALALGVTDRVWSIGDLIDAALAITPDDLGRRRKPVKLT